MPSNEYKKMIEVENAIMEKEGKRIADIVRDNWQKGENPLTLYYIHGSMELFLFPVPPGEPYLEIDGPLTRQRLNGEPVEEWVDRVTHLAPIREYHRTGQGLHHDGSKR